MKLRGEISIAGCLLAEHFLDARLAAPERRKSAKRAAALAG